MRIGYTMARERGALDPLLADLANRAGAAGLRLAGVVQRNPQAEGAARCDMEAVILPDGPAVPISQSLGRHARGCRLDEAGLAAAVAAARMRLEAGCDLLLVNKFGKAEALGRGFRDLIAEAVARGVPVLVGVGPANLDALQDFAGGAAEAVEPDALLDWCRGAVPAD